MQVDQLISNAKDAMTVKRVFGEPYEKGGVTFIPAAVVAAGAGGGGGSDDGDGSSGEGGGFGAGARPAGAYVIAGDQVRWEPAVDINRLAGNLTAIIVVWLFTRVRMAKVRTRAQRRART